jgi:hypothetical protein
VITIATLLAALGPVVAAGTPGSDLAVQRHVIDPKVAEQRAIYTEGRPVLRGFRAPMLEAANEAWPFALPDKNADPKLAVAAEVVATRLARDGLLATTAQVMEILGAERFAREDHLELLRAAGLPVDWLAYFSGPEGASPVRFLAERFAEGLASIDIVPELGKLAFAFRATIPGFQVATESGENAIDTVRLQVGNATYYSGPGDGGTVDVARQLFETIPDVRFVASIEEKNLAAFQAIARGWKITEPARITLVAEPFFVGEWAQDNGKSGIYADGGGRKVATLAPRYASRGEDGASFVPGETFALEGFAATGRRVVQSPLFFQGGNLLPVLDPKSNKREMLVGEAELFRNTTLGLTTAQVLEAFRVEFGVERCLVLPALSFHVDYELCVRSTKDGLVAFVNDTSAAARLVLEAAVHVLEKNSTLSAASAKLAIDDLHAEHYDTFMARVTDALSTRSVGFGAFPESFAKTFVASPVDSGVGNLQRVMLALDILTAEQTQDDKIRALDLDAHLTSYLISLRRRESSRDNVAQVLRREGFKIVAVPSSSEGKRSLNTVNGVHVRGTYYMPAYGGMFAEFDSAARKVFETTLGPDVAVVPILCGESQRRDGALHCAISILPVPP